MRTTLNLDDEALAGAMEAADGRTKTEVINDALRRVARANRRRELLDLREEGLWQGDVDLLRRRA